MAQPVISLDVNTGTQATPAWTNVTLPQSGTGVETRWSDQSSQGGTAVAAWPAAGNPGSGTRAATAFYLYRFSADTVGVGVPGGATPLAFTNANYLMCRWSIGAGTFTFLSRPILTAYNDSSHGGPTLRAATATPPHSNLLSGSIADTGSTARSYLKANAYGVFGSTAPAVASTNAPVVTDGTTGSVSPAATPAWLPNWQSLMGDLDFITCASIPIANTAAVWYFALALFTGVNLSVGTHVPLVVLRYVWS
jgi:hypothetical protein